MGGSKSRSCYELYQSPVAQLVEQMTVNHLVVGSSPTRGATFYIRSYEPFK